MYEEWVEGRLECKLNVGGEVKGRIQENTRIWSSEQKFRLENKI